MTEIKNDPVNHPSHYTDGKYETIDFIESWGLGFHLGNAVKYISRAGKKDSGKMIEDLEKAKWYLTRAYEKEVIEYLITVQNAKPIPIYLYCADKQLSERLSAAMSIICVLRTPEAAAIILEKEIEALKLRGEEARQ